MDTLTDEKYEAICHAAKMISVFLATNEPHAAALTAIRAKSRDLFLLVMSGVPAEEREALVNQSYGEHGNFACYAAYWNAPEVIPSLERVGVRPSDKNSAGRTPLGIARDQGHREVETQLRDWQIRHGQRLVQEAQPHVSPKTRAAETEDQPERATKRARHDDE